MRIGLALSSLVVSDFVLRFLVAQSLLGSVFQVIQEDPDLMWRVRPHTEIFFEGAQVQTSKRGFRSDTELEIWKHAQVRIFIMGASPSFGWGVEHDETYAELLKSQLNQPGYDVAVVNASQIGYSSFQGLKLARELMNEYPPTHIFFSYLINDLDSFRFYFDSELEDHQVPLPGRSSRWFNRSGFFQASVMVAQWVQNKTGQLSEQASTRGARVSLESYEQNLEQFVQLSQQVGAKLVVLKMPVNLPEPVGLPGNHFHAIAANRIREKLPAYHSLQEQIAKRWSLPLIRVAEAFDKEDAYLFIDPKRDTIHPNALGHELIARLILEQADVIFSSSVQESSSLNETSR